MNSTLNRLNRTIRTVTSSSRPQDITNLTNDMFYLMSQGFDLSSLAGSLIKLFPICNISIKNMVCSFLIKYSENISDLSILVTNSLQKDFDDPNPQIRKLVIRTVCSVPILKDLALQLLPRALEDPSVHVRETAAACCSRVVVINEDGSSEIIDKLYNLIRDDDALIVCNVLMSLEEILKPEGGVVIPYKMAKYLMSRLVSFPEFCISSVCHILKKYTIKNEDEAIEFLNILDPNLSSGKTLVILSVMDLILLIIQKFNQNLEKDVLESVKASIFQILSESSPEMTYIIMEQMQNLIFKYKDIFSKNYKIFFCNIQDPAYLKIKKLSLLPLLLKEENCNDIAEEIIVYLTGHKDDVSKQAVSSFMKILEFENNVPNHHIDLLTLIFLSDNSALLENMLISISSLDLQKFNAVKNTLLSRISEHYSKFVSNNAKISLLSILSDYGQDIENAPYILEEMSNDRNNLDNEMIHNSLVMAAVRMLIYRPAEMQLICGKIIQDATESPHLAVRRQAEFYNSLLRFDVQFAAELLDICL